MSETQPTPQDIPQDSEEVLALQETPADDDVQAHDFAPGDIAISSASLDRC